MTLDPLSLLEAKSGIGVAAEIAKDLMLEKFCLLVVSLFCIATEIRFMSTETNPGVNLKDARVWHYRALDIAKSFLPKECPLSHHIQQSYERNYGAIPQSKKLDYSFINFSRKSPGKCGMGSTIKPRPNPKVNPRLPLNRLAVYEIPLTKRPTSANRRIKEKHSKLRAINTERKQMKPKRHRHSKSDPSLAEKLTQI